MTDRKAFDRQIAREVDYLAGPEPRVDVARIVATASQPSTGTRLTRFFGSVPIAATAAVGVLLVLVVLVILPAGPDGGATTVPGATPTVSLSPAASPLAITGTWTPRDDATCEESEEQPVEDDPDIVLIVTECSGLSITASDPRLTATGGTRLEIASDGPPDPPAIWSVTNDGGGWRSVRFQEHERFVFLGTGGYEGMTAVLNLYDDGSLDGILQEPPLEPEPLNDTTDTEPTPWVAGFR